MTYRVLMALALSGLSTAPAFAYDGARQSVVPSRRLAQAGSAPSPSPHSAATPAPHSVATPQVHGTGQRQAYGSGQPQVHGPVQQQAHGTGQPQAHGSGQPSAYGAGQPQARGAGQLRAHGMGSASGADASHRQGIQSSGTSYPVERRYSGGHRVLESTRAAPGGGTVHAVRYGRGLTGVVEHPMKSGYSSRTYVQGGRVLYARVYHTNSFQRYGHAFSYERLVPAIAFSTAYYAWAARPWSTPVSYQWGWNREPWHRAYGNDFTPYSSYNSLDEWLTDYVVAQSMRNAYESWQADNAPVTQPPPPATGTASGPRPYWDDADESKRPYWEESADDKSSAGGAGSASGAGSTSGGDSATGAGSATGKGSPAGNAPSGQPKKPKKPAAKPTATPDGLSAEDSPPVLSGEVKAALNAQIKRQLVERQTPAQPSQADDLPDSLKPGHTLFRVNNALDVPSTVSGQTCPLRTNDYIERTGDMDQNGMVPVKVKAGGAFDCAIGLNTQVAFNDLESMESEQQQALTDALMAASKNMGSAGGLPQAPSTAPMLLAAGQTSPTPDATRTLGQLQ